MNEFDVGHGPSNFDDALLSCDDSGLDIATFASEVNPDQNEVCKERTMKKTTINILGRVAPIHEINLESDQWHGDVLGWSAGEQRQWFTFSKPKAVNRQDKVENSGFSVQVANG